MRESHGLSDVIRDKAAKLSPAPNLEFLAPNPNEGSFETNVRLAKEAVRVVADVDNLQGVDQDYILSAQHARTTLSQLPVRQGRLEVTTSCGKSVPVLLDGALRDKAFLDECIRRYQVHTRSSSCA